MNNQTVSLYTKIIFSSALCIPLHMFAMEITKKEYNAALDWRSKCVPVKSSQIVPSKHSLNYQKSLISAVKSNNLLALINLIKESHSNPECNININVVYNENKNTPLHLAADLQRPAIMANLLKNGALPNVQDDQGITPLGYAIFHKNIPCIELLLKHGADQTVRDIQQRVPNFWLYKNSDDTFIDINSEEERINILKIHKILICNLLEKLQ